MKMRPMNRKEMERVDQLLAEGEELYGELMDNRVIYYVQEKMIEEGLRVKVPYKEPSSFFK